MTTRRFQHTVRLAVLILVATIAAPIATPVDAARSEEIIEAGPTVQLSRIYVFNNLGTEAGSYNFVLGTPDTLIEVGDWNGSGKTGFAARQANILSLTDQKGYSTGLAAYGRGNDVLIAGDWDGDGTDSFGVRRRNQYYLRSRATTGVAETVVAYGRSGDEVFIGDWTGNNIDTFAIRRRNLVSLSNSTTPGPPDLVFGYGRESDKMFVGDWDGDGIDTFALRRGTTISIRNDFQSGPAGFSFELGEPDDELFVGDWDGNGSDTFAFRRIVDEPVPLTRDISAQQHTPFASVGGISILHPDEEVEFIGFHEAGHTGSQQMLVEPTSADWTELETRYRNTGSRTAADIVVPPTATIRSPITGTVVSAGTYTLYCDYRDDFVNITPDAQPGWQLRMFHIDGVQVSAGQRVVAGETVLAPRATRLPFDSQVDEFTGEPSWPHVHVEVVDLSIPDERPVGPSCP